MPHITQIYKEINYPYQGPEFWSNQTPRVDQAEDVKTLLSLQRSANYSEVGTGKTLVSYLYVLAKLGEGKKAVVVMPPALIPQYHTEMLKIFPEIPWAVDRVTDSKAKRWAKQEQWEASGEYPDVLLMSYSIFMKMARSLSSCRQYKVFVFDEAHALKTHSTKIFACVSKVTYGNDICFLTMTATPVTTELKDSYAHIQLKTPGVIRNFRHFEEEFIVYKKIPIGVDALGRKVFRNIIDRYKNEDRLSEILMQNAVRRREDVLQMERPVIIEQRVDIHPKHRKLYQTLLEEQILEMGDNMIIGDNPSKLRQLALQLVTSPEKYSEKPVPDAPLETLTTLLEALDLRETKFVLFCHYQMTVRKLQEELKQYNPAAVYGGSDSAKNVAKFQEDPSCRGMIANYSSGGAGLNLQHQSHNIFMYEPTSVPALLKQAIGRCQRKGQEHVVRVWIFRHVDTLSEALIDSSFERTRAIEPLMQDKDSLLDALKIS